MSTAQRNAGQFQIGEWVTFDFGARRAAAQVVEDRGQIGVNGRRLYRVRPTGGIGSGDAFEMPEDDLASVPKDQMIAYFIQGGLVQILRDATGRADARTWLTIDSAGRLSHTFDPLHGMIGGFPVPLLAEQDGKIFLPRKDDVLTFLKQFGLTHAEAEHLLRGIGTAP